MCVYLCCRDTAPVGLLKGRGSLECFRKQAWDLTFSSVVKEAAEDGGFSTRALFPLLAVRSPRPSPPALRRQNGDGDSFFVKSLVPGTWGVLRAFSLHPAGQWQPDRGAEVCVTPATCPILAPEGNCGEAGLVR